MYDEELIIEILKQIYLATQTIIRRFDPIKSPEDFVETDEGMDKLDAICMQLIAIGENLKNLDKITNYSLLSNYPNIEWKKVKGMRDVISHHYFDLNEEAIFNVCQNHVEKLGKTIQTIINEME